MHKIIRQYSKMHLYTVETKFFFQGKGENIFDWKAHILTLLFVLILPKKHTPTTLLVKGASIYFALCWLLQMDRPPIPKLCVIMPVNIKWLLLWQIFLERERKMAGDKKKCYLECARRSARCSSWKRWFHCYWRQRK